MNTLTVSLKIVIEKSATSFLKSDTPNGPRANVTSFEKRIKADYFVITRAVQRSLMKKSSVHAVILPPERDKLPREWSELG